MNPSQVRIIGLPGLPVIVPGTDLAALTCDGRGNAGMTFEPGDVLVVTQKIVSKAEGDLIDLTQIDPRPWRSALPNSGTRMRVW